MEIEIKFNEIKNLTELKENLSENLMLKIFDIKWVDVKGNKLDEEEYKQRKWLKEYIDLNTSPKTKAKNDVEKDYFVLIMNDRNIYNLK